MATNETADSGATPIPMMQAADHRVCDDLASVRWVDGPRMRRVATKRLVATEPMVIGAEGVEQSEQMPLAEHYDVIEQLAPERADQPFHKRVLPGTTRRNDDFLYAEATQASLHLRP